MSRTSSTIELQPSSTLISINPTSFPRRHSNDNETLSPPPDASSATPHSNARQAWTVVLASAIFTFWLNGIGNSWGVMQAALLAQGLTSTSTLSFVGSVSITCTVVFSLLSVRFMRLVGARWAGLIGIVLIGLGELTSGFTTGNIAGLFGTAGVLFGVGSSLCFMVASILPSQHFSTHLGLANGLVKAAGGLGGTILSIGLDALIRHFEGRTAWPFRIVGLICLATGVPAAFLISNQQQQQRSTARIPFFDFSLFRSRSFSLIFLAGATGVFALFVPPFFLPLFAQSLALPSSTGAYLAAGYNLSAALGRLGAGVLCDRVGAVNTFLLAMLVNAGSMLAIWPVSDVLPTLGVFAVINGVANGAFFTSLPTVITQLYGPARSGVAMGMVITGWSAGYFMGAPIAGYLLQAAGGGGEGKGGGISAFRPAIFYAGAIALVSAVFVLAARVGMERKVWKRV